MHYSIDFATLADFAEHNADLYMSQGGQDVDLCEDFRSYHAVGFEYSDLKGDVTHRVVEPHKVWYKAADGAEMMVAYCYKRGAFRMFYVEMMKDIVTGGAGLQSIKMDRK